MKLRRVTSDPREFGISPSHTLDLPFLIYVDPNGNEILMSHADGAGPTDWTPVGTLPGEAGDHFIYRPGATGENAPGGKVYTDADAVKAALAASSGRGPRTLELDPSFIEDHDVDHPLLLEGEWNLTNVRVLAPPREGVTYVEFANGENAGYVTLDPTTIAFNNRAVLIEGYGLFISSNRTDPDEPVPFDGICIITHGYNVSLANQDPEALPIWRAQGFTNMLLGAWPFGGLANEFPNKALAAPVLDLNGGGMFLSGGGEISPNFATDLSESGGGTIYGDPFLFYPVDVANGDQWSAPDLIDNGGAIFMLYDSRVNRGRINPTNQIADGAMVTTADNGYQISYGEQLLVDTTDVVTMKAPSAARSAGDWFHVKDGTDNAATKNVTIQPADGETIEDGTIDQDSGSATWRCYGNLPKWYREKP